MSTKNLPVSKGRPACKVDNLTAISEPIVYKMWEPRRLTALWASTACCRDSFYLLNTKYYRGKVSGQYRAIPALNIGRELASVIEGFHVFLKSL
jgi:hypothetical protein